MDPIFELPLPAIKMKIQLQRDKSAYLQVSPDLKVVSLIRTYDDGSEAHIRDLDEYETNFVTSTIIALTSQMQEFFKK